MIWLADQWGVLSLENKYCNLSILLFPRRLLEPLKKNVNHIIKYVWHYKHVLYRIYSKLNTYISIGHEIKAFQASETANFAAGQPNIILGVKVSVRQQVENW